MAFCCIFVEFEEVGFEGSNGEVIRDWGWDSG